MLKGKSKIQLFDAVTGEQVLEQRDENLVTNALDILMNSKDKLGLLRWWREKAGNEIIGRLTDHIVTTPAYAMMPLAKGALGGIILWENNITENPSITVPSFDVSTEVGHAGVEYSGADTRCGTYNSNESGEISGGWRHVWDFGTDKANGTIKCLTLTSQHGGNLGYHCNFNTNIDAHPLYTHCYFHSENYYETASSDNNGIQFSGSDDKGSILYMKKNSDGGLKLLKRFKTQMWYINTYDISKVRLNQTAPTIKSREELASTLTNQYSALYVYQGKIHEIALISKTTMQHRTFDLNTGAQLTSKNISLPFSYSSAYVFNPAVYRDGKYYCFTGNRNEMITVNEQGQQLASRTFPSTYYQMYPPVIDEFSGNIILSMRTDDSPSTCSYPAVITPGDKCFYQASFNFSNELPVRHTIANDSNMLFSQFIKTDDMNSPFLYFCDANYAVNIIPLVNTAYLATINNLQSPIIKTSAQTMKITYEIYDE